MSAQCAFSGGLSHDAQLVQLLQTARLCCKVRKGPLHLRLIGSAIPPHIKQLSQSLGEQVPCLHWTV